MTESINPFATINATNIPQNLLSYDGKLGQIYAIAIKNFFLIILTLGIYSSWATNHMRKYTFGSFSIGADRLEYSGKGGQLFKGFLIIGALYIVLILALDFATKSVFPAEYEQLQQADADELPIEIEMLIDENGEFDINGCIATKPAEKCEELYGKYQNLPKEVELSPTAMALSAAQIILTIAALVTLSFFAKFSAARYRLSQAKWRGIGGGIAGASFIGYIGLRFKRLFLNIISLGYLVGRSDLIANKYILNNAYIGKTKFNFEPDLAALDRINLITLLLAIPTLGASRIWYRAALLNYKYKSLSLAGMKFESSFKGGKMLWLMLSNILIIVFTLFIGTPITIQRNLKFFAENVRVMGNANNLELIEQSYKSNALGEGVDQVFDLGNSGIDFGVV